MKKVIQGKIHGANKYKLEHVEVDYSKKQQMYNKIVNNLMNKEDHILINMANKDWQEEEDKKITEIYKEFAFATKTQRELCEFIASELNNGRTWKAIENRLWVLGINTRKQKYIKRTSVNTPKITVTNKPEQKAHDFNLYALYVVILFLMATIIFMVV